MNPEPQHLQPTSIIDSDHEAVRAFADRHTGEVINSVEPIEPVEQAVALYYAVRDGIRYNPYTFGPTADRIKASATIAAGEAWCVPKAILLVAACRAIGIPARIGFADVRNHLSTQRMREMMKTDIFHWHGYAVLHLEGSWVKATPAFNIELCEKFRLKPLEFDGRADSLYHPFDLDGKQHMEYIRFRGEYDDVPWAEIVASFQQLYTNTDFSAEEADFDADCDKELP